MNASIHPICDALFVQPRKSAGAGRALMLVGAQGAPSVTPLARATAEALGPGAVYAIDLDLRRNPLARAFAREHALGPRIDGVLSGARFHGAIDARKAVIPAPAFGFHRVGRTRIFVGAIDGRLLPAGARITLSSSPDYWNAARAGGAMSVVVAPALDQSKAALCVARHMDGVVLVVSDEKGAAPAGIAAKAALNKAGANVMGLIYVGAETPVLAFDRLLRQAG